MLALFVFKFSISVFFNLVNDAVRKKIKGQNSRNLFLSIQYEDCAADKADPYVALHFLTLKLLINRNVQFKIYLCASKVISHKSDSSTSNISANFLITSSAYIGASREISSKLWMRVNGKLITLIFNYVKLEIAFPFNLKQQEFGSSINCANFIEICCCQPIPTRSDDSMFPPPNSMKSA